MPLYDYKCGQCGKFELEQSMLDEPLKKCPKCQQPIRRLFSVGGIMFKGSGFYVTDNAKKSTLPAASPAKTAAPAPATPAVPAAKTVSSKA